MSVEEVGKAPWLEREEDCEEGWGEESEGGSVARSPGEAEPNLFSSPFSCSMCGVSLARGTCLDMGAGDWFAANGGKGQAAHFSLLLFP